MPLTKHDPQLEQIFQRLTAAWKRETKHLSRVDHVCAHPSYLQIIGMGTDVLPFIFRELDRETDYWFVALESITRTSPAPDGMRMSVEEMAQHWLRWGREHGYL